MNFSKFSLSLYKSSLHFFLGQEEGLQQKQTSKNTCNKQQQTGLSGGTIEDWYPHIPFHIHLKHQYNCIYI